MKTDKDYCASSYLTLRFILDENINFYDGLTHQVFKPRDTADLTPCRTATELGNKIKDMINIHSVTGKTAVLLSGGMDSAILASYLPKGTTAYTFKCVADGAIDETEQAKKYCDAYGLKHKIIEMYWEDFEKDTPEIIKDAGVPVHSIEIQLYKAARQAKLDGIEVLFYGASADLVFGGMDKLLSRDWTFDDWKNRYTFVQPRQVLKKPIAMDGVFDSYRLPDGKADFLRFLQDVSLVELETSYMHAFKMAGIKSVDPYSWTVMAEPFDLKRIRNGESKYIIRELFSIRYPTIKTPNKIPMPRATEQWLKSWTGPVRDEFISHCINGMTGDQKWLVYCLETFFNTMEKGRFK